MNRAQASADLLIVTASGRHVLAGARTAGRLSSRWGLATELRDTAVEAGEVFLRQYGTIKLVLVDEVFPSCHTAPDDPAAGERFAAWLYDEAGFIGTTVIFSSERGHAVKVIGAYGTTCYEVGADDVNIVLAAMIEALGFEVR